MARTIVNLQAVKDAIQEATGKVPLTVLSRGNYPHGTFYVWWSERPGDTEFVTVNPGLLAKYHRIAREERLKRKGAA